MQNIKRLHGFARWQGPKLCAGTRLGGDPGHAFA